MTMRKLQKGLKSMKLHMAFIAMFTLSGFDGNRERKARAKKLFGTFVKNIRQFDQQQQKRQNALGDTTPRSKSFIITNSHLGTDRIKIEFSDKMLPEKCLPYAISLLAHNTKIESISEESKVKQIKE